jgi:phosphatidylethanolamine-binding protein (PEBP) family uncharacterized protein
LFAVTGPAGDQGWWVPSVRSGAQKLPDHVHLFDGGNTWGNAYNAPCPTADSWLFTLTVYALDGDQQVVAVGNRELGYAP